LTLMKELGMAEDQVGTRKDHLRETFVWTRLFGTFKVALDPKKLLLAAAGIVMMAMGWWILSALFFVARSEPSPNDDELTKRRYELLKRTAGPDDGAFRKWPWSEPRGPNPVLLINRTAGKATGKETGPVLDEGEGLKFLGFLVEPLRKFLLPVVYLFHPGGGGWNRIYFLLIILWTLITWAFFGAAITRIAAVQFARNEKIGMMEGLRFAWSKYISFFSAPLFPLVFLAVLTIFLLIFGLFQVLTVMIGDIIIAGLFWPFVILLGLVMAMVVVGLVGWPLMYATISAEGSDSFDALSRSYSYVYQAPWSYLWYSFLAIVYGAVVVFFVGLMGTLTVYLGKWAVSQNPVEMDREPTYLFVYSPTSLGWRELLTQGGTTIYTQADYDQVDPKDVKRIKDGEKPKANIDESTQEDIKRGKFEAYAIRGGHWWNYVGAALVAFWVGLIFLIVIGFSYSYFWCASTIIYLLMRRKVDDTDIDEVHLEEDEMEEAYTPPAPPAGAGTPPAKQPVGTPNLIPPESLTMRSPPEPTTPAAPPDTAHEPPKVSSPPDVPASPPAEGSGNSPSPPSGAP
jgi:hypothetical protein